MGGGRFFGFVIGGALPAAIAADWLDLGVGPERRPCAAAPAASVVEEVAGALAQGAARPPGRRVVRARDRLPDGARDRARRGTTPTCSRAPDRMSSGTASSARRRSAWSPARSATARSTARCASSASGRAASARSPADAQGRMRRRRLRDGAGAGDGPTIVCAQVGDVNTGASTPSRRSPTRPRRPARGCTSTARSACGRRRRRARHLTAGSSGPTPGRPTRTSGSTCPTTAASRSCAHPESHRAAMGIAAGT